MPFLGHFVIEPIPSCVDDLSSIPMLRTELKSCFCDIVMKTVGSVPSPKKPK